MERSEKDIRKAIGFFVAVLAWHYDLTDRDLERPLAGAQDTLLQIKRGDVAVPREIVTGVLRELLKIDDGHHRGKRHRRDEFDRQRKTHHRRPGDRKDKFDT